MSQVKIAIQGFPGCFHEEAAAKYFTGRDVSSFSCLTFDALANEVSQNKSLDYGIIAIENSIAGSLLQNYRILREHHFLIVGEVYLRIRHNLMALPGQNIDDIKEVSSHPMALNQCLDFLHKYPSMRLVESNDTALSAKIIRDELNQGHAAIGSAIAAEIYNLEILAAEIETSKVNYTRFFIIKNRSQNINIGDVDKASIYCLVDDTSGSLLKVMQIIANYGINISKLQSYPVLGKMNQYFFYIDLEIENHNQFKSLYEEIEKVTLQVEVLGLYQKASIYDHKTV